MGGRRGRDARAAGRAQPRLPLLPEEPVEWPIDEHTRQVGRRGVAEARAALRAARRAGRAAGPGGDAGRDRAA